MVMPVGVQSNQLPRAPRYRCAVAVREAFKSLSAVCTFPAPSACSMASIPISTVPEPSAFRYSLARPEGRLDQVLQDAAAAALKPLYNFYGRSSQYRRHANPRSWRPSERTARQAARPPSMPAAAAHTNALALGTIINVSGRKSRRRSPDDVEKIIRVTTAGLAQLFHH